MKTSRIKQIIKEEIQKLLKEWEPQRQPVQPKVRPSVEPDVMEPGTKPEISPKRRTLTPNRETTPNTRPKALMEKEILDKITQRFKSLKGK